MSFKRRHLISLVSFLACLAALPALAADDQRPIKIIVPFAPGGTTDLVARLIAPPLAERLKQPVFVVNAPGAGGSVGTAQIAQSAPDGLTLGIATVSGFAANPATNSKIGYDPLTDFTPIMNIAAAPNVIAVHPSFPAKNWTEFVRVLKVNPGKYSYATSGAGSVGNLQMEQLKLLTGTSIVHIPFTGAAPAVLAVVSGQGPEIVFDQLPSVRQQIFAGKLKVIAIASPKRLAQPLDMPTLGELGYPSLNRPAWYGLVGPKGMDKAVFNRIEEAMQSVLIRDFGTRQKIDDTGADVVGDSPEHFAATIKSELENAKSIVKARGIKVD